MELAAVPRPTKAMQHNGPRTITVLGSTGSIGTQTIDLLHDRAAFHIRALVAGRNVALLAAQARQLNAERAVISAPAVYADLKDALFGTNIAVAAGPEAVIDAASEPADWTMAAITGAAGLPSTLAAISRGQCVALANKEALVCAGEVMLRAVREAGATLLPVDSEHNAIFQSMADGNRAQIDRIVLTASGGPFRTWTADQMRTAPPEAALRHPTWTMGAKITIDSATLMNKGLELIEAARLFDLPEHSIGVLIHPQSTIHGLVYYTDGSVLAQLGSPDMRIPIAHTLAWPARMPTPARPLDLAQIGSLTFFAPDDTLFPALRLAREALRAGAGAPTVLSAANEIAVDAYLNGKIGFLDIARLVERVMTKLGAPRTDSLQDVIQTDAAAREEARQGLLFEKK